MSIPSNGLIVGNTPALLAQNINSAIPLDYREGYIESWNFALQRQLPKNFTIEAAYVGNHTVRAPVAYNINAGQVFNGGAAGRPTVCRLRQERRRSAPVRRIQQQLQQRAD